MARGQYDLPLNRARPAFGPQRPPVQAPSLPKSLPCDRSTNQQTRSLVVFLCTSATAISKNQLVALRARFDPEATIQLVDTADSAIASLSRKPSAVIVLDNAISQPAFELARPAMLQYAQAGGRLITDLSQTNMSLGATARYHLPHATEQRIDYSMSDSVSDLSSKHLVS